MQELADALEQADEPLTLTRWHRSKKLDAFEIEERFPFHPARPPFVIPKRFSASSSGTQREASGSSSFAESSAMKSFRNFRRSSTARFTRRVSWASSHFAPASPHFHA